MGADSGIVKLLEGEGKIVLSRIFLSNKSNKLDILRCELHSEK
jgi:hypothetical protein